METRPRNLPARIIMPSMSDPLPRILVAGASGQLGRCVVARLRALGHPVRTLSRRPEAAKLLEALGAEIRLADATEDGALAGVCDGVDVVCSCLGGSVSLRSKERRGYQEIDVAANRNLLAEARRAGVKRFVYVGAFRGAGWAGTAYARAHETFATDLAQSGIPHAVVRPTGLFSVFAELLDTARGGPLPVVGGGASRTNPIHDDDVAALCVDAIRSSEPALAIDCGGPDVVTRREIDELCFAALGRKPRLMPVPALLMRVSARLIGLFHRRLGQLFEFATAVATNDCVAPSRGQRHLADFLRERAPSPPGGAT